MCGSVAGLKNTNQITENEDTLLPSSPSHCISTPPSIPFLSLPLSHNYPPSLDLPQYTTDSHICVAYNHNSVDPRVESTTTITFQSQISKRDHLHLPRNQQTVLGTGTIAMGCIPRYRLACQSP